ncbi:MAG TPA: sigma-70 family RNA polymerase sigma factor [Chitinophaga sp.]|uniref:RNA polymerase sigma factor n=1 Tax=Chitinophaga sp. TaxID=1869181 RepID=UPI002CB8B688|nr:sigma-70 family RNA polymerase sigma factor [Chitinophaga sp.]HVI45881.1 sigma-70 family RNA polymerase sigma factor [Chitinophaga sp.]
MNELTERELIIRIKSGDGAAFAMLYNQYYAAIFLNVFKLVGDREDAMDVVQDVFIILWQNRSSLNAEVSPKGFLYVISHNRSHDFLRSKTRSRAAMYDLADHFLQESFINDAHIDLSELQPVINQLSPKLKRVLELCRLEEKTYHEASLELGISRYTVNEYLKKAIVILRKNIVRKTERK